MSNMPMMFSRVDLPEPDGPITERNSPSSIRRLMSFKIKLGFPPMLYHFDICCNEIMVMSGFNCLMKCVPKISRLKFNYLGDTQYTIVFVFDTTNVRKCDGRKETLTSSQVHGFTSLSRCKALLPLL